MHDVLQADWHDVWHSPHPPLTIVFFIVLFVSVFILCMSIPLLFNSYCLYSNTYFMKVKVFFYHVSNIIAVFPDIQLSSAQHVSFGFLYPSMPPRVPPAMQSSRDVMPFTENILTPP